MKREDRLLISHRPYAVNLDSWAISHSPACEYVPGHWTAETWRGTMQAVWFRRRRGETVACIGQLWDTQRAEPRDAVHWLEQHEDGRYGGDARGRWDGTSYWGNVSLAEQEEHLAILRPMLENYPDVPPGYDGWWSFPPTIYNDQGQKVGFAW